jgi:type I restriction enzyme S subunit
MSDLVPDGWLVNKLSDICSIVGGGTPERVKAEYWGEDIPWVSPREITSLKTRYITTSKERITQLGLNKSSAKLHPIGTVLMTSRASIGYVAINTIPVATNQGFQSFQCNEDIYNEYLYQHVLWIRPSLEKLSAGSTFLEISSSTLKTLKLIYPPLPEQQKIAAILTSVDQVIEKTQAQIDKLKDLKTAMMQELLTCGVGVDGKPHTEFKDSPVGRIPKGWDVKSIGALLSEKIIDSIQDGNHGEKHPKSADFVSRGIPFVMASDIHNQTIDIEGSNKIPVEIYENLRIGFAKSGDVLLSHKATVGLTAIVPDSIERLMLTPQVTYYRIGNTLKLLSEYLHYVFQSSYFQESISLLSAQSTRSYIGIKAQRELEIIVPNTIEEQEGIVEVLRSIDNKIILKMKVSDNKKSLKKALMQDLLTGKVRVAVPSPSSPKAI